jgi:alpha-L-fucosidase
VIELTIDPKQASTPGTGTGLSAEYFANSTLSGTPAVRRVDPNLNFAWRYSGSPAAQISSDNFSARWTGFIQPRYSDMYTFTTVSDDTVRVWVDGRLLIDSSTPHEVKLDKATIALQAGRKYSIKVEHTETRGEAYLKLLWASPNVGQHIVPQSALYTA